MMMMIPLLKIYQNLQSTPPKLTLEAQTWAPNESVVPRRQTLEQNRNQHPRRRQKPELRQRPNLRWRPKLRRRPKLRERQHPKQRENDGKGKGFPGWDVRYRGQWNTASQWDKEDTQAKGFKSHKRFQEKAWGFPGSTNSTWRTSCIQSVSLIVWYTISCRDF